MIAVATVQEIEALPVGTETVLVKNLTDAKASALSRLTSLRTLVTDGNNAELTDIGLESIGGIPSLESLDLEWATISDAGLLQLAKLTDLRKLDLDFCRGFSTEGIERLCLALPSCQFE